MTSHLLKGTSDVHVTQSKDIAAEEHVAEPEIDIIDSKEPMGPHVLVGTSDVPFPQQKNIVQEEQVVQPEVDILSSKELEPQNLVKLLHLGHQLLLILAFVTCATIQYPFGCEGMVVGLVSTPETAMLMLAMVLDLIIVLLYSRWSIFGDLKTYWRTVAIVLQDYVLLIILNRKYMEIAIIPFTFFAFMYALASNDSKYQRQEVELKEMASIHYLLRLPLVVWTQLVSSWKCLTESSKELVIMAAVPYLLQLGLVVLEEGHVFTFSSFLLFLGSALSALTVMITSSPAIEVSDGVDQVLPVMHKTCMVMLVLTAHSMAAEWLGEDIVLACMPELISVLAWFTIYCHHPEHLVSINSAKPRGLWVIVLSSAGGMLACLFLAYLYGEDLIILRSCLASIRRIFSSSSALSFLDACLLDRWPAGSTPDPNGGGLVQLLKFYSVISSCVSAACMLCAFSSQYQTINALFWSLLAIMLGWLVILWRQNVYQVMYSFLWSMLDMLPYRVVMHILPYRVVEMALDRGIDEYKKPPDVTPQMNGLYEKDGIEPNAINAKYLEEILLADAASKRPEVVCIFGLPDCGKTVSAMNVYEQIKRNFDYHLSVMVGKEPHMAQLITNMIRQVKGTYESGDVDQLTQILSQFFQKKRYLVMLDDLWSREDWRTIQSCFPPENPKSRIIITTRNEDAAKAAADHLYWIPVPVEANVEGLFSKEVPQWKDVEQMKQLIKVRYNGLSPDFRTCLLYLSIFPKKYEVEIERLVRLWLALGFGGPNGPIKEETARSCIKELIDRKLIEESSDEYDDTLRGCAVHPLIHEFIVCQATENQFLGLVLEEQRYVSPNYSKVRWLSVQNKSTKEAENYEATVRSINFFGQAINFFGQASGIPPLGNLTLLRVLDLEDYEGPVCLDGLLQLEFLSYLSLRGTNVSELPEWIGELIYLQTLDVRSTKVKKLPPSIVRLKNLMHLLAGVAELPPGISKMKALVTLSCASTMESSTTASIKELGKIARLREFELFHGASQSSQGNSQPSTLKNKGTDDEKQVVFLSNGFPCLEKLSIHCSFTSVIFKTGALPNVQELELKFDKGVPEESAAVSIIQHLPSLERVIVKFSQGGADSKKTWDAVNMAAEDHHNEVSVYGYKSDKHGFGALGKSVSRA